MNINIYCDYEIKITDIGSQKIGYDEFQHFEEKYVKVINGGSLLETLRIILESDWVQSLDIDSKNQIIKIEIFNPITGENSETTYEIKRIEK